MTWKDMAVVGAIARPHGIRGQVVLNAETDFPEERFRPGHEVFVERRHGVEALTLTAVRFHKGRPIVGIAGVESIEEAQQLAGLELRVPADQLVPLSAGTFYRHDLVGCRVMTEAGVDVGVVTAVEGTFATSRLVVAADDQGIERQGIERQGIESQGIKRQEILIPLTSRICTVIEAEGKRIVIDPPEGLLELNRTLRGVEAGSKGVGSRE